MIEKMTKYSFVLLNAQKEEFLKSLQELGLVDITRASKPVDAHSEALFASIEAQKRTISNILAGRSSAIEEFERRLEELGKEKAEATPWGHYDKYRLAALGLPVSYFIVPRRSFDETLSERYALERISEDKDNCYIVVLENAEGFPGKRIAEPARSLMQIDGDIAEVRQNIREQREAVELRKGEIPMLEHHLATTVAELGRYLAAEGGTKAAEDSIILFEGFAPVALDEGLAAKFDTMDIVWLKEEATVEDNPPISFHNNRFVRMFEVITDMYGRPAYNGFDPTPYISVFFLLFFALCMGDAGYGLLLIIAGILLKKVESFRKLAPLVSTLGVATVFVGLFLHTFFSIDLLKLEWIPDGVKACMLPAKIGSYDGAMVLAIIVGIIHLSLALIVKTIYATKTQGFRASLSVWGWTLFLVGSVAIAGITMAGVIDKALCKTIIIVLGVISAIGIFPLRTPGKNPLVNIGAGLWETYNTATGMLGDVLSYLRLYALGLAGGMLGFAFNDLAKMALGDGSAIGCLSFILIVIIGHTLNLAMAALGAFVHPLRLNFLEFFKNSGYQADGKVFSPLKK